mgnify:CR=1 FL=1|jgi:proteasome accessory factor B
MALLGKKYITKSAIFANVDGYSGTPEAMERMFERDKTDLRELGIVIEVGGFDPLFEDEPGYRILNSDYTFTLEKLDSEEIGLLALAADIWAKNSQSESAKSGLRKIKSLVNVDEDEFSSMPRYTLSEQNSAFHDLWKAVTERSEVVFDYSSAHSGNQSRRTVQPFGIGSWHGSWYLVGRELESDAIKSFRISRIVGEIKFVKSTSAFVVPADFKISDHLIMAKNVGDEPCVIEVKKGSCFSLRSMAQNIVENESTDRLEISNVLRSDLTRTILWSGPDVKVLSPENLRIEIEESLAKLATR